jgi:hypothetical protein
MKIQNFKATFDLLTKEGDLQTINVSFNEDDGSNTVESSLPISPELQNELEDLFLNPILDLVNDNNLMGEDGQDEEVDDEFDTDFDEDEFDEFDEDDDDEYDSEINDEDHD